MSKKPDDRKLHQMDQRSRTDQSRINKKEAEKVIEASLRDKLALEAAAFPETGEKEDGYSEGYIGTETSSGNRFLLKQFYKNAEDCEWRADRESRVDGVQELIAGTMYEFLLHDQAPKVQLVTSDAENPKFLHIRSKYFEQARSIGEYHTAYQHNYTLKRTGGKRLDDIQGIEKVYAASHILGENDSNIMVVLEGKLTFKERKSGGRARLVSAESCRAVKIDHGRSFMKSYSDLESIAKDLCGTAKSMEFNVEKYSNALNQMISDLSEQQIEAITDKEVDQLKKAGLDPDGILSKEKTQAQQEKYKGAKKLSGFDILKGHYKDVAKENLQNMKEIAKQVEIVAKFSIDGEVVTPKFKDRGWVHVFSESATKDPIQYAIDNNIKIDKLDARVYKNQMLKGEKQEIQVAAAGGKSSRKPTKHVDKLMSERKGAGATKKGGGRGM